MMNLKAVIQDLESESFAMEADHSQKMKASDSDTRDCVTLPSSTALFRLKYLLIFLIVTALFWKPQPAYSGIIDINSIREIANPEVTPAAIFLSLDDTLIDYPYMLGCRAWRQYIKNATTGESTNWHNVMTLFVAQHVPMIKIESFSNQQLKLLHLFGIPVIGITDRGRNSWHTWGYLDFDLFTMQQLTTAGIQFKDLFFNAIFQVLAQNSEYFEGVFFVGETISKGQYLKNILQATSQKPKKIIYVDDNLTQIQMFMDAMDPTGILYDVYHYKGSDAKNAAFDPLIANIQLYYLYNSQGQDILNNEQAADIAQQHPERDANWYLQELINNWLL